MRFGKLILIALVLAATVVCVVAADDTGTVSIVGKNQDTSDPKAFGLTLVIANTTWTVSEPGNAMHFFTTKRGSYVRINNVVSLLDGAKKEVGRLNNIVPESAKKGDTGNGRAEESGIVFQWEVK
jgi:hypothetical protein